MEYLMTYGWAIMVVLIVGIVLWQLGIFKFGGTSKTFTGFGAIKPLSWAIPLPATSDGSAIMMNGENVAITPTGCEMGYEGVYLVCEKKKCKKKPKYIVNCDVVTAGDIPVGGAFELFFHQCDANCPNADVGDPYEALLNVTYSKTIGTSIETHVSTGELHGFYE